MSNRRALVVGMSYYNDGGPDELPAAKVDVNQMERVLETHFDLSSNFEVIAKVSEANDPVTAETLLTEFSAFVQGSGPDDHLVFYFSGHGSAGEWGLQLLTAEHSGVGSGVPFEMLMYRAGQENFGSLTCILDCCFAGRAAVQAFPGSIDFSLLRRNVTILASSSGRSYYDDEMSDYTREIVAGLDGDARDSDDHVTPFELHRWTCARLRDERNGSPILKSNCSEAVDLRSPSSH